MYWRLLGCNYNINDNNTITLKKLKIHYSSDISLIIVLSTMSFSPSVCISRRVGLCLGAHNSHAAKIS